MIVVLVGCQPQAAAEAPPALVDSDTPVDTVVDAPEDTGTTASPPITVTVTPQDPGWDQDLTCEVAGLPAGWTALVSWDRNRIAWTGVLADTAWEGDTIPQLAQAGGQRWRCLVVPLSPRGVATEPVVSAEVRVRPPMEMIEVPGGRPFLYLDWSNAMITRDFLMQRFELTGVEYRAFGTTPPASVPWWPEELAVQDAWDNVAWTANEVSRMDGVTPCYPCTGTVDVPSCAYVENIYACDGYRMPTEAEWIYAACDAGTHSGMLPSGLNFAPEPMPERGCREPPSWGGTPGQTVSDECWWMCHPDGTGYQPKPGGLLKPNALGFFDMCGNLWELTSDPDVSTPRGPADPHLALNPDAHRRTARVKGGAMGADSTFLPIDRPGADIVGGVRFVRSLEPSGRGP